MNETLEILDNVRLNFSPSGLLILNFVIAFVMFGVALDIKIKHFRDVLMKPKSAITGLISQFLLDVYKRQEMVQTTVYQKHIPEVLDFNI